MATQCSFEFYSDESMGGGDCMEWLKNFSCRITLSASDGDPSSRLWSSWSWIKDPKKIQEKRGATKALANNGNIGIRNKVATHFEQRISCPIVILLVTYVPAENKY